MQTASLDDAACHAHASNSSNTSATPHMQDRAFLTLSWGSMWLTDTGMVLPVGLHVLLKTRLPQGA